MAQEAKSKIEIPWATLLPLLAAFAGIVAQYKPLVSKRPATPKTRPAEVIADQDVDARLWEDPLVVVQKQKALLEEQSKSKDAGSPTPIPRHSTEALANRITQAAKDAKGASVLLLAVMLDSGPYLEQEESRLRGRQAVMEGLSESGFVPVDGEHIGFVIKRPWPPPIKTPATEAQASGDLVFAWEECRNVHDAELQTVVATNKARVQGTSPSPPGFHRVFVLWLPGASLNPLPLGNFATLITDLVTESHPQIEARLIGPATSTGLQNMLLEAVEWPRSGEQKFDRALDGLRIYSPRATASDEALYGDKLPEGQSLEDIISGAVTQGEREGLQFWRTIIPDDEVLSALIEELPRRHVHVAPWKRSTGKWANGDHVIILTEWDNPYGRSLARTFKDEAGAALPPDAPFGVAPRIDYFRYMHGIDGRLPGDTAKDKADDSQKKENNSSSVATEATEGINHADFLQRLALRLKKTEAAWLREGDTGVAAIGLLGSDIYDKLMILRALRPEFPNAIFFTNNYDAHFERREDWDDVHNLVIASPFGGTLSLQRQRDLAPFRDNDQTSMFASTLLATGNIKITELDEVLRQPHIFEIGRKGAHELARAGETVSALPPNKVPVSPFSEWIRRPAVAWGLLATAIGLIAMIGWIGLSVVDRKLPGGGSRRDRLKRILASTPLWLALGVPLIVLSVGYFSQTGDPQSGGAFEEPLAFLEGISIWPSEMVRLIALLLAIHFMVKAHVALKNNELELTSRFRLGSLPSGQSRWRHLDVGLRRWQKEHADWMARDAQFTAKEAWTAYLRRNQFRPRVVRIVALLIIYGIFSAGVMLLFPIVATATPARGETAFRADFWVLLPAVIGMMTLTFYVVDAIRLNSNFIRVVTGGVTQWEPDISLGQGRIPPLTEADLSRYYDISFIAQRSEVVAPLIWYPLIVLAAMFVARSSYFDNWTWPASLILIFALNATWAFGSAAFLRRAAEQLRETAISNLKLLRTASYKDAVRQKMFDELISEIQGLKKGAFAPLSEQPFVRAVIVPSGGLGLLAVGQRLLDLF